MVLPIPVNQYPPMHHKSPRHKYMFVFHVHCLRETTFRVDSVSDSRCEIDRSYYHIIIQPLFFSYQLQQYGTTQQGGADHIGPLK